MKRKIIKQGNNTLTVTLPRSWTEDYKIKPGDELNIELKGNALVFSVDKLLACERKKTDISKLTSILPFVLLSFYRKGYDEVELTFEKQQTSVVIQSLLKDSSIGYHLIEHGRNFCILRALSDVGDIDFNEMLRKLFLIIKIKLEKVSEAIAGKDVSELHSIVAMSAMPSKITDFCYRLISKRGVDDMGKTAQLYNIVSNLENLDNHLNHLINMLLNVSLNFNSRLLIELICEFKEIYSDFYASYYNFEWEKITSIMNRKDVICKKLSGVSTEMSDAEYGFFLGLNNSFLCFSNMVNTAAIMGL